MVVSPIKEAYSLANHSTNLPPNSLFVQMSWKPGESGPGY
ncbi:hypothetical protein V6Z11_A03G165600 [Gossypium hirsutum]